MWVTKPDYAGNVYMKLNIQKLDWVITVAWEFLAGICIEILVIGR